MAENKRSLAAVLVVLACVLAATCALTSWLNAETRRVNAKNECLAQAIELEQGKTVLLQLVSNGTLAYADVSDLMTDTYEVPDDLDVDGYADLKQQIKSDTDKLDAYLATVQEGASNE